MSGLVYHRITICDDNSSDLEVRNSPQSREYLAGIVCTRPGRWRQTGARYDDKWFLTRPHWRLKYYKYYLWRDLWGHYCQCPWSDVCWYKPVVVWGREAGEMLAVPWWSPPSCRSVLCRHRVTTNTQLPLPLTQASPCSHLGIVVKLWPSGRGRVPPPPPPSLLATQPTVPGASTGHHA